jgi:hypothetical protein
VPPPSGVARCPYERAAARGGQSGEESPGQLPAFPAGGLPKTWELAVAKGRGADLLKTPTDNATRIIMSERGRRFVEGWVNEHVHRRDMRRRVTIRRPDSLLSSALQQREPRASPKKRSKKISGISRITSAKPSMRSMTPKSRDWRARIDPLEGVDCLSRVGAPGCRSGLPALQRRSVSRDRGASRSGRRDDRADAQASTLLSSSLT